MDKIIIFERKEECCGCSACCMICPREAIVMKMDEEGFYYPEIQSDKCIGCKKCINICPIKKAIKEQKA